MGRFALGLLLGTLGEMLKVGSRVSGRFRAQVTEDLTIEVSSADGVAHHYVFRAANRSVVSRRGPAPTTRDLGLRFESAALGFRTLVRPDALGESMKLLLSHRATYTGNAVHVLWFWGLTRMVLPYGRDRRLSGPGLPGALTAPNPTSKVADRITREPVAAALDPGWVAAVTARDQMAMLRRIRREDVPMW